MLFWQEVTWVETPVLQQALQLYQATFPPELLEPTGVLLRGIELGGELAPSAYHFLIGTDDSGHVVAMATVHYLARVKMGFVVYLLVDPAARSKGLGGQLLAEVERRLRQDAALQGERLRGIVLETEREEDMHDEQERLDAVRRTDFFKRSGFVQMEGICYLQPPLEPQSRETVPLHLFIRTCDGEASPTREELQEIVWTMYQEKYGRMNGIGEDVLRACHERLFLGDCDHQQDGEDARR